MNVKAEYTQDQQPNNAFTYEVKVEAPLKVNLPEALQTLQQQINDTLTSRMEEEKKSQKNVPVFS